MAAVEFTQVIQQYQTLEDLQADLTADNEPPVPIVSYKPAVMRVYFTTVKDATTVTLMATGAAAQQLTLSLPPDCSPTDARRHLELCPSMDIYFIPPSGAWSTTLTLTDDQGNQLEVETLGITSRDALGINYKAVSVCTIPNQPSSCQSHGDHQHSRCFQEVSSNQFRRAGNHYAKSLFIHGPVVEHEVLGRLHNRIN